MLKISDGCHPYPVVQADGSVSGGLKYSGRSDGSCKGYQVYARSAWHSDVWGIMYAWYFPKVADNVSRAIPGHRHYWEYAIIWIDNLALDNSKLLGASISQGSKFDSQNPVDAKFVNGSAVKVESYYST
ncbi:hypothetical protein V7S43_010697 [Phytophthora oleae]|uniref:Necrosis inducing-like protein NPP1 type n=1 Tax=Phytophthora oleae TaxID=2107226 RepID=A0ABD3FFR8_9STRA